MVIKNKAKKIFAEGKSIAIYIADFKKPSKQE